MKNFEEFIKEGKKSECFYCDKPATTNVQHPLKKSNKGKVCDDHLKLKGFKDWKKTINKNKKKS